MEPRDVFISHTEQDRSIACALAAELRALHVTTWTYEEDGVAGISYLTQIYTAIESCRAFVLLASPKSVNAHQVVREVEQAHERAKAIIPARIGMSHQQFIESNPILRMACGTAVTLAAEEGKLPEVARRIAASLSFSALQSGSTPKRAFAAMPIEGPLPAIAAPASKPAAPSQSQPVVAPVRPAAGHSIAETTSAGDVSEEPISATAVWIWPSIWLGVIGQIAWAGAVAYDLVRNIVMEATLFQNPYVPPSHWIAPAYPVVVIGCGLGLSRSMFTFRRSGDISKIHTAPNMFLGMTAVCFAATHFFLATAVLPDPTAVNWLLFPGLSPYFVVWNVLCLGLVWNGVRALLAWGSSSVA